MKKIFPVLFLGTALILNGCKKEKVFFEKELEGSTAGVGFGLSNSETITLSVEASSASVTEVLNIFAANGGNASVTLAVDESLVTAYNEANGTEFPVMPSDTYTIPTSATVSGGKGSAEVSVDIPKLLTYGISFAVGVKITASSGGTNYVIPGNSEKVIIVQVKNKYDGVYTWKIKTVGWSDYGIASGISRTYPGTFDLSTVGAGSVEIFSNYRGDNLLPAFTTDLGATAFGATSPRFTFDPATDQLISVTNIIPDDGRARTLRLNTTVDGSRYDATAGAIYAAYIMSQSGRPDQYYYDTLYYQGSR